MSRLQHPMGGWLLRCGALFSTLVLAACGPGTGGSGNDIGGTFTLGTFGATASSICSSSVSSALLCPPGTASTPTIEGTQMVLFSDTTAGNNVAVSINGNLVELAARCLGLRFVGEWGITAPSDARFFGTYTANGILPTPATLTVQAAGGAVGATQSELVALLRDTGGRLLLGPVLLKRVAAPVTNPAACPS